LSRENYEAFFGSTMKPVGVSIEVAGEDFVIPRKRVA